MWLQMSFSCPLPSRGFLQNGAGNVQKNNKVGAKVSEYREIFVPLHSMNDKTQTICQETNKWAEDRWSLLYDDVMRTGVNV